MRVHGRRPASARRQRGFTIIEVLIVLVILGILAAIAIPIYSNALEKSRRSALAQDMAVLHRAFLRYYADHSQFPSDQAGGSKFDLATMAPLTTGGYFQMDSLRGKILDGKAMFYSAPDISGTDSHFILVARSKDEPNLWAYAISYDWGSGQGYEGVYFWVDGQFVQVN